MTPFTREAWNSSTIRVLPNHTVLCEATFPLYWRQESAHTSFISAGSNAPRLGTCLADQVTEGQFHDGRLAELARIIDVGVGKGLDYPPSDWPNCRGPEARQASESWPQPPGRVGGQFGGVIEHSP